MSTDVQEIEEQVTGGQETPETEGSEGESTEPKVPYYKTEKGKAAREKYMQSEKAKEARSKYQKSDKAKEARNRWQNSEKGKEARKRYQDSERGKEARKRYHAKRREALKALRDKEKAEQAAGTAMETTVDTAQIQEGAQVVQEDTGLLEVDE